MFEIGEKVILNENIKKDYPSACGEVATITRKITSSPNYQYDVLLENGDYTPIRECEMNKLTEEQLQQVTYIKRDNQVLYTPTNEIVKILKVDLLHGQIEIEFQDAGIMVVGLEKLRKLDKEIDSVENNSNNLDSLVEIFYGHYKNNDDTYTVPKQLLVNLLDNIFEQE